MFVLLAFADVDILGVRLLVHNPLLRRDRVTKDDFLSAREQRTRFLVDILVLVFVVVLQPILVDDPPHRLVHDEIARERVCLVSGIPDMASLVSLRSAVVVVPAEVYPVSRVVAVRLGEPALREREEREEIYEYGAERRVCVRLVGVVGGGVISASSSPAASSSGGSSPCGGCAPVVLGLHNNR